MFKFKKKEDEEPIVQIVRSFITDPNSPIIITKSSIGIDLDKTPRGKEIMINSCKFLSNFHKKKK